MVDSAVSTAMLNHVQLNNHAQRPGSLYNGACEDTAQRPERFSPSGVEVNFDEIKITLQVRTVAGH